MTNEATDPLAATPAGTGSPTHAPERARRPMPALLGDCVNSDCDRPYGHKEPCSNVPATILPPEVPAAPVTDQSPPIVPNDETHDPQPVPYKPGRFGRPTKAVALDIAGGYVRNQEFSVPLDDDTDQSPAMPPATWTLEEALQALSRADWALRWLLQLKDGPRNDTYHTEKPLAWQYAREAVRATNVKRGSLSPTRDTQTDGNGT